MERTEAWPSHSFGSIISRARAWGRGRQADCTVLAPLVAGNSSRFACDDLLRLHVATLTLPNALWHGDSLRDLDKGTTGSRRYRPITPRVPQLGRQGQYVPASVENAQRCREGSVPCPPRTGSQTPTRLNRSSSVRPGIRAKPRRSPPRVPIA